VDASTADSAGDAAVTDAPSEAVASVCAAVDASDCEGLASCIVGDFDQAEKETGAAPAGSVAFAALSDVLAYFDDLARLNHLDIPAHGIDCNGDEPLDASVCEWNPMQPRLDAGDVHYSNQWNQFTTLNGDPMIWTYFASSGEWLFVDGTVDPGLYQAVLSLNECTLAAGDASAD